MIWIIKYYPKAKVDILDVDDAIGKVELNEETGKITVTKSSTI